MHIRINIKWNVGEKNSEHSEAGKKRKIMFEPSEVRLDIFFRKIGYMVPKIHC